MKINNYIIKPSIFFYQTYNKNHGHLLWDDIYSVYSSIVRFNYSSSIINIIPYNMKINTNKLNDLQNIIIKFFGGKVIDNSELKERITLFKTFITGSSRHCQRCINTDYTLKDSREYNITKLMRNRLYKSYNIKQKEYSKNNIINGIIIDNKRYNIKEKEILFEFIKNINNNYNNVNLKYINYKDIKLFSNQLKLLSQTNIYISGPGTGLLYFPFLIDPGIVIHLGHIHFGCPQYLEQYIAEGCSYIKSLYYPPNERMNGLNITILNDLFNEGLHIINSYNKPLYYNKGDNLNQIGKLFVKICEENYNLCNEIIEKFDWCNNKCRGVWAENFLFFPSLYKNKTLIEVINKYKVYESELGCEIGVLKSKQSQWC